MNAKSVLGVVLCAIALCLAGGGVYAFHTLKQKKFDPETLCPLEGSKAVTLILIDKTDPLTEPERARAEDVIGAETGAVQRGDRIVVTLLHQNKDANETSLETLADLCNPGSEANPLFENPKRVAARYRNAFRDPIEKALESVEAAGSASLSPIAQSIYASMEAIPETPGQHLRLIVISDLMENSAEASAYSGSLTEAALKKAVPAAAQARLKGAETHVLLLSRPRYAKQQAAAITAWRRFLAAVTGHEPEILRQ